MYQAGRHPLLPLLSPGFDEWNVKLIVTCRQEHIREYGKCTEGAKPLYIQGFEEKHIREYLSLRLLSRQSDAASGGVRFASPSPQGAGSGAVKTKKNEKEQADKEAAVLFQQMQSSKIRESYTSPFRLTMAVDLYVENSTDFGHFEHPSQLYERWLCHCWQTNGASEAEMIQEIGEVMRLAWELHRSGTVQRQVSADSRSHAGHLLAENFFFLS